MRLLRRTVPFDFHCPTISFFFLSIITTATEDGSLTTESNKIDSNDRRKPLIRLIEIGTSQSACKRRLKSETTHEREITHLGLEGGQICRRPPLRLMKLLTNVRKLFKKFCDPESETYVSIPSDGCIVAKIKDASSS